MSERIDTDGPRRRRWRPAAAGGAVVAGELPVAPAWPSVMGEGRKAGGRAIKGRRASLP